MISTPADAHPKFPSSKDSRILIFSRIYPKFKRVFFLDFVHPSCSSQSDDRNSTTRDEYGTRKFSFPNRPDVRHCKRSTRFGKFSRTQSVNWCASTEVRQSAEFAHYFIGCHSVYFVYCRREET